MTYRLADCLVTLRDEINARWPDRDKTSDGWIGDAAHATRTSDHNPWIVKNGVGIVRAIDVDEDGIDGPWLAEHLRQMGAGFDPRLAGFGYIIYEGRIAGGNPNRGPSRWNWRPYTGTNAHPHHLHISCTRDLEHFDSTHPWRVHPSTPTPPPPEPEDDFMAALTPDEQKHAYEILKKLEADYLTKGKGVRQVLAELDQRSAEIVQGVRTLLGRKG